MAVADVLVMTSTVSAGWGGWGEWVGWWAGLGGWVGIHPRGGGGGGVVWVGEWGVRVGVGAWLASSVYAECQWTDSMAEAAEQSNPQLGHGCAGVRQHNSAETAKVRRAVLQRRATRQTQCSCKIAADAVGSAAAWAHTAPLTPCSTAAATAPALPAVRS